MKDDDLSRDLMTTFYRCKKCSRVTNFYPIGCRESDCPIKRDWSNDATWQVIYILIFLFMCGLLFLSAIGQ